MVKALADPTRLRIVDTLRKAAPEAICQCELLPLFDMCQPALAKHLKVLVGAGVIGSERRGLWAYYFLSRRHEGAVRMAELTDIRETVRERYAAARPARGRGCGSGGAVADRRAGCRSSARASTTGRDLGCDRRRPGPRSAAGCRPPSPTCTRARPSSTSAPARARTC